LKGEVERGFRSALDSFETEKDGRGAIAGSRDRSRSVTETCAAFGCECSVVAVRRARAHATPQRRSRRGRPREKPRQRGGSTHVVSGDFPQNRNQPCVPPRSGAHGRSGCAPTPSRNADAWNVRRTGLEEPRAFRADAREVARVNVDARGPWKEINPFGARSVAREPGVDFRGPGVSGVLASPCPETARPQ